MALIPSFQTPLWHLTVNEHLTAHQFETDFEKKDAQMVEGRSIWVHITVDNEFCSESEHDKSTTSLWQR